METSADLNHLLLWLGQTADGGARRYVEIRQKLVALFAFRGCDTAEDLADETIDRTAKAIIKPGFTFEGNPIAYMRGVARNVYLESLRRERTVSQEVMSELADAVAESKGDAHHVELLYDCLDRCLARLPGERRSLLLRYYQGERSTKIDGRVHLAKQEGLSLSTLRIQIFRLRKTVRRCVETCAKTNVVEVRF